MKNADQYDAFGVRIAESLQTGVESYTLPADFAQRIVTASKSRNDWSWWKVAAAMVVLASALGLVFYFGLSRTSAESSVSELASVPTFVFLRPEASAFWNTTANNTMTVPIDFPRGTHSAELRIEGEGYRRVYSGITGKDFTFELPAAVTVGAEYVYDLVLTFDDDSVRTARLGLVKGLAPDSQGLVRCLAPKSSHVWQHIVKNAELASVAGGASFFSALVGTDGLMMIVQ